jgi:hypothetical protein
MSDIYICSGSLDISPILKAVVVVTGAIIASTEENAFLKSSIISARPLSAFR